MLVRAAFLLSLAALVFGACSTGATGPSPAQAPGETVAPSAPPIVDCLGGLTLATCADVERAVETALTPSGWTPTHLWINSGTLCPSESCVFDPDQNFPAAMPPEGGSWIGNAEVAFAQTDKHAGLNIAQVGSARARARRLPRTAPNLVLGDVSQQRHNGWRLPTRARRPAPRLAQRRP